MSKSQESLFEESSFQESSSEIEFRCSYVPVLRILFRRNEPGLAADSSSYLGSVPDDRDTIGAILDTKDSNRDKLLSSHIYITL